MYGVVLMAALSAAANDPACHGKCGCYGGYGYGGYGGYSGVSYGGCYGWGGGYGGGYYGGGCYGSYSGGYAGPASGPASVAPASKPETVPAPKPDKEVRKTQAKLVVEVPEDAKLYIDDQLMKTPAGKRSFRTPQLEQGEAYYYVLRAEVTRDGQTRTETKRVIVRAGDQVKASFSGLEAVATVKR